MVIRTCVFTGWIRLLLSKGLYQSQNLRESSTLNMSGKTQWGVLASAPSAKRTPAWFFKRHSISIGTARLYCSCFMLTNRFLASTEPTIPYTVSASNSKSIHAKNNFKVYFVILTVSILNLHEDERQKPENWIPIGWMPIYDDKQSKRPTQGYEADPARKARLFHDCFRLLLRTWDEETKHPQNIVWGDQKRRQTRFFLGGLMGDQQVMDMHT